METHSGGRGGRELRRAGEASWQEIEAQRLEFRDAILGDVAGPTFLDPPRNNRVLQPFERVRRADDLAWSYLDAARVLADSSISPAELLYPSLLLLRHSLELAVKFAFSRVTGRRPGRNHNLEQIWQELEGEVAGVWLDHESWSVARDQVGIWHRLDSRGMSFRYVDPAALLPQDIYALLPFVPDLANAVDIHEQCVSMLSEVDIVDD